MFAHGFLVPSDTAGFLYKTTGDWFPEHERSLLWSDSTVGIILEGGSGTRLYSVRRPKQRRLASAAQRGGGHRHTAREGALAHPQVHGFTKDYLVAQNK